MGLPIREICECKLHKCLTPAKAISVQSLGKKLSKLSDDSMRNSEILKTENRSDSI